MKTRFLFLCFAFFSVFISASAQGNQDVEMADILRESGKIYTVVAGIVIILTGMIIFLLRVERKLSSLEEEIKQKEVKN